MGEGPIRKWLRERKTIVPRKKIFGSIIGGSEIAKSIYEECKKKISEAKTLPEVDDLWEDFMVDMWDAWEKKGAPVEDVRFYQDKLRGEAIERKMEISPWYKEVWEKRLKKR